MQHRLAISVERRPNKGDSLVGAPGELDVHRWGIGKRNTVWSARSSQPPSRLQLRCRARSHLPNTLTFRRSPTSSTSAL